MSNSKGLTVFELLISISLLSILLILGFSGFKAFQNKARVYSTIRTVTTALNTARYRAIEENRSVKVSQEGDRFCLKMKNGQNWETVRVFHHEENARVFMNNSPVFHGTGYVSPLCSITVNNDKYNYKITISIAGRIKVTRI